MVVVKDLEDQIAVNFSGVWHGDAEPLVPHGGERLLLVLGLALEMERVAPNLDIGIAGCCLTPPVAVLGSQVPCGADRDDEEIWWIRGGCKL